MDDLKLPDLSALTTTGDLKSILTEIRDLLATRRKMPTFMLITGTDGTEVVLNLDQVRMVDQISPRSLRLVFSERHVVNLTGKAVPEVLSVLGNNCMVCDGTPLPEAMMRAMSQSPSTEQVPDPTQEA